MHRHKVLSFFSTKKNPAPAGEDEGCINPAARESPMQVSIGLVPSPDSEYSHPRDGVVC